TTMVVTGMVNSTNAARAHLRLRAANRQLYAVAVRGMWPDLSCPLFFDSSSVGRAWFNGTEVVFIADDGTASRRNVSTSACVSKDGEIPSSSSRSRSSVRY